MSTKKSEPFGGLLIRLRRERGIRQRDVALAADLALSTVSKQEQSARATLRPANAARLATYLHGLRALPAPDLALLRLHCGLPADWAPGSWGSVPQIIETPPSTYTAGPSAVRERVQRVHQALLEELGAQPYLEHLSRVAQVAGVSLPLL